MKNRKNTKPYILLASSLGMFTEGSIYFFMIFMASKSNNPWLLTSISFASFLPGVFLAPVLGWAIDKMPVKKLWAGSLLGSGITVACMMLTDSYTMWVILLAIQTMFSIVVGTALFKVLPKVPSMSEKTASSWLVGMGAIFAIITPPVASFIFSIGAGFSFMMSAIILVFSALIIFIFAPEINSQVELEKTDWKEALFGLKALKNFSLLKMYIPVMFVVVLFTTIEDLSGIIYLQDLGQNNFSFISGSFPTVDFGTFGYSLVVAMWAIGSFIGSVISSRPWFTLSAAHSLMYGGLLICLGIIAEGAIPSIFLIGLVFILGGMGNAIHNIGIRNVIYSDVPERNQGQVWALIGASFMAVSSLGKFLGTPYLLGEPRPVILFSGILGMAVILLFMATIKLRPVKE